MSVSFEKSLKLYKKFEKSIVNPNKFFFCQSQKLFSNYILPNSNSLKFNKETKKFNFKIFLIDFFLALISTYTLIKVKIKGIRKAHYLIDIDNSNTSYDRRSKYILDIVEPNSSINFIHIGNYSYSFKNCFRKKNAFYFESFFRIFSFLIKIENLSFKRENSSGPKEEELFFDSILKEYNKDVCFSKRKYIFYSKIISFLNLEKFIFIDDSRHINELILVCKENKINTVGYMHARFNEFHVGLFYFPFDKYLVFSNYFKEKILSLCNKYSSKDVIVVGHPNVSEKELNLNSPRAKKNSKINVLFLGVSNIDYEELIPYLKKLIDSKEINLYFRGKPGELNTKNTFFEILNNNKIKELNEGSFITSLTKNSIDVVMTTHSTALMESWLVGVPSIYLKCSYDYAKHLIDDKISYEVKSEKDLIPKVIECYNLTKQTRKQKKEKIWSTNPLLKKDLLKQILE